MVVVDHRCLDGAADQREGLRSKYLKLKREQRTKLSRSELAANDVLRGYHATRRSLLLRRVPISRRCDAFVTNFTAAEFRALYRNEYNFSGIALERPEKKELMACLNSVHFDFHQLCHCPNF
ncbi:hypothetical protein EVAR_80555_1 [Eumeta japonica]|uniref:Uncharacterized protein n=1 Tax=Eumeta variegata TaxID=151549 RepID=A0A4C1TNR7_EUMVA|nr:hypothetical protein EVAR_80555_1 [Eumeta japonica]